MKDEFQEKDCCSEERIAVDVSEELIDLLKVYISDNEKLISEEETALQNLTHFMKRFIDIQDRRMKSSDKLNVLRDKIFQDDGDED